jgi:hypothetical protein
MSDEMVTCTKCGTEAPRGTPQCPECNSFLPGSNKLQKKGGSKSHSNTESAKRLLLDNDLDWSTCGETMRLMAQRAVSGSSADLKAFLQQAETLKAAPRAGQEKDDDVVVELVITGETVDEIEKALAKLEAIRGEPKD